MKNVAILQYLENLETRQLEVLVGKYIYKSEMIVEDDYKIYVKKTRELDKRKYTSYLRRKEASGFTLLPRYATDIRNTFILINHVMRQRKIEDFEIKKKNQEFTFSFGHLIIKGKMLTKVMVIACLMLYLIDLADENDEPNF